MRQQESWVAIVDDDASVRVALARALRGDGFRVETFESAEHFLSRTTVEEPGCVVLDVNLAQRSGFELQDLLVARGNHVPIIFISAHDELAALASARNADGYLIKPFHMSALVALLEPHLHLSSGA